MKSTRHALLEEVIDSANSLSTADKIKLVKQLSLQIEQENKGSHFASRGSLRGIWKDVDISEEDIVEARKQMWKTFPREDIG